MPANYTDYLRQLAQAKAEYDASPVYVVPDKVMYPKRRYGEEVPRQTWQETLDQLVRGVQMHQAKTPVYMPFAPGTPTLEREKFDWLKKAQEAGITGYYEGQPTWKREYGTWQLLQKEAQEEKPPKPGSSEYKATLQSNAVKAMQAALDSLWRQYPSGPPVEDVQKAASQALNEVQQDLARSGLTQEEIDKMVETVKQYAQRATGLDEATLWGQAQQAGTSKGWLQRLREALRGSQAAEAAEPILLP